MGRLFLINLEGDFYSCKHCRTHFALEDDVISRSFICRHGMAHLFDKVVNVTFGEKEERMMLSGLKTVVDIFCVACGSILGWRYEVVHEQNQKYKEGKFILEM
ncbi:protein yippee-like At3g08990 isoform X2 [Glycine max]|nr:protein yippee-like At3g08990 isoform X2 [Glycine max]